MLGIFGLGMLVGAFGAAGISAWEGRRARLALYAKCRRALAQKDALLARVIERTREPAQAYLQ